MAERNNGTRNGTRVATTRGRLSAEHRGKELPIVQAIRKFSRPSSVALSADHYLGKIFVLDTNVLMHDPSSLYSFEEHDVFLPMMTLEELDHHKKGMTEIARNVRETSRMLDEILKQNDTVIEEGISLLVPSNGLASGRLFLQTKAANGDLPLDLPTGKADNLILSVAIHLQKKFPQKLVILVSKDINMRIKASCLNLLAEDYFSDKVMEDTDLLPTGTMRLPPDFWETHGKGMQSWKKEARTYYKVKGPLCPKMVVNNLVYLEDGTFEAIVKEVEGKTAVLETLIDYTNPKNAVWGINARNREQNFAFNLLMNPDIDQVFLLGPAGTGKTLLALAAGLTQVFEAKRFSEVIMTRLTVPVGDDIGFLPGTEEEKMGPWMEAIEDSLDVLTHVDDGNNSKHGPDWGKIATMDMIRSKLKIKSLNMMRGRSFLRKYLIIDEAQNLTPKQMKTLITRAGPGTKVVCLGNLGQIDTPYLTEGASGLTYAVDRFKGWQHSGHVILQKGERSRLADFANEKL